MSTSSADASSEYRRKRMIGLFLVVLGGLFCLIHMYTTRDRNGAKTGNAHLGVDFRPVYASSRCLIVGCNPYSSVDTKAQFLAQGGSMAEAMKPGEGPFRPYYMGYPPPALFYLAPLALLRWTSAWLVYLVIGSTLYGIAVMLFADLCSEYVPIAASACLALFLASQETIVMLAQPTLLPAALLCIGVWCLLKNRYPRLGVLSFAVSLMFKPQLGGLFLLYFLVATPVYRKRAWQVIGLTVLLCLPPLLWFSAHASTHNWVQDYKTNIAGITKPGQLSDPGPLQKTENGIINLQVIVSHYRDEPAFYNGAVFVLSAMVIAVWLYPVIRRRPSQEKDILCIAAIAIFSMLPVYHRIYDSRALLIVFPALALLMQRTPWWGRAATLLTLLMTIVLSDQYAVRSGPLSRGGQYFAHHGMSPLPFMHAAPWVLLLFALFYVVVLYVSPPPLGLETDIVSRRIEEPVYP